MTFVLNHNHFSGLAVTSIEKSFSGVIEEGVSIAEALEGCQFRRLLLAFCQPFAGLLPAFCWPFASLLPAFCQPFAGLLPAFCRI